MLKFLHNTVFHDSLESLFEKIKTTIPLESKQYLDTVRQTFQVTLKQFKEYGKYQEVLNTIKDAALNHRTVEMVYFTMGRKKKTQRKVDRYRILFFNGTFYVIGYCHLRKDCRTFALERIKMLTMTDESFKVPEDFRLEDYMGSGFGVIGGRPEKIKIWFSPDIAGYIKEKTWHESQVISQQRDGSIIFEADIAITEELLSWIMSWGSKAEVLEPTAMKDQIHEEALAMLKAYDETPNEGKQMS
jgi:predicted DNA-binding transcriptional regulator YafY